MSNTLKILTNVCTKKVYPLPFGYLRCVSNYTRDIIKQPSVTPNPDYLLQNLKNATHLQKVLELVGSHHSIMNSKQLMQALRSLFTLQKYGNSNLSTQQIIDHPQFDRLCYCLKMQAGMIELNETIEALKVVSYVGVPSSSIIVQVLLQLLRHNINDLSLHQIIFLDFLLRQFKSSPLVDGLLIALPIVFEIHLPIKMDKENISHMADCLQYVSKKTVSDNCIQIIIDNLIKYIDTHNEFNVEIAKSIIWSVCDMKENDLFQPLLTKVIHMLLTNDIDKLDYHDINTTITKLLYKYSTKYPFYYNDIFVDTYINYIIDKDLGFMEAVRALHKCVRVNHSNDNLLNYVSQKCYTDPELILQSTGIQIYSIVAATALSEFRPVHWDALREAILKTNCYNDYCKRDILWMKFAASLCALDIYKFNVLEKALDEHYLRKLFKLRFASDYDNYLIIYQAFNMLQPDFKHLLPPNSLTESVISKLKLPVDYPMEAALHKALGGNNYVKTCIKTKLGHQIDHIIVLRKGGFPISLSNNNEQYLEDIEIPYDSQMVIILALNHLHYTLNNKRLKATSALTIKTLESQGYTVIPVCMETWESMPDFEKIPFLMQQIRVKTEANFKLSDAV